jgi:fibronectin type 3 domain-containing protein
MKSIWFSLSLILMAIQLSAVYVSIGTAAEVTLLWNANDEADLDGYSIYQSTDSSGSPYDWIDDMFLDELADPDKPEAVVTQLEDGKKYYFVVTAFDKSSNESSVSNEICVKIEGSYAVDCSIEDSPEPPEDSPEPPEDSPKSDSGDGGGGGGG